MYTSPFPIPAVTADVVLIGIEPNDDAAYGEDFYILLVKRGKEPFVGKWALPGGHVNEGEEPIVAAAREGEEETGHKPENLQLVDVFGKAGRDPRGWYVTVAYYGEVEGRPIVEGQDDALEARWWPLKDVQEGKVDLAFDHAEIIEKALQKQDS